MPVPITDAQAQQLQTLVQNAATATSNAAASALLTAQQTAADAATAEATADGTVNVDIGALLTFVQSLTGTPVTPAPTPAT